MDIASIITGILGGLGFATSIISILYVRQQTRSANEQVKVAKEQVTIANKQMKLMSEEAEKKKAFADASKAIIQAIDYVKKTPKVGILSPLDFSQANILTYLHDHPKITSMKLIIASKLIKVYDNNGNNIRP